jgi:hypothetical protein
MFRYSRQLRNQQTFKFKAIISTVKPSLVPPDYVTNALNSWEDWTENITLFNIEGAIPWRPTKTRLRWAIPTKDPPQLIQLIAEAAQYGKDDIIAIVNSDILLGQGITNIHRLVRLQKWTRWAATSPRWTYTSERLQDAQVTDYGIDIFVAPGNVWSAAFDECPEFLRMGCILWDNWMNCWFLKNINETYVNMRGWKCVYHPKHDEPRNPNIYTEEEVNSLQFTHNGFPPREFRI